MKEQYGSTYDVLEASLADIPRQVGARPKAVLVVSGHWEEREFTLSSGEAPGMIYDYGGFPAAHLPGEVPGAGPPELAARAAILLAEAGYNAGLDPNARLRPRHLQHAVPGVSGCRRAGGAAVAEARLRPAGAPERRARAGAAAQTKAC